VILTFFCPPGEEAKSTPLRKALMHALWRALAYAITLRRAA
jgi:hypothetical protein